MAIGGALFEQRRVAVVPADDQAQVSDRGVGGRAGSDDDGHATQAGLEEPVVARVRARIGAQACVGIGGKHPREGALQQVEALGGGNHGDGAPPGGCRGGQGRGEHIGPGVFQVAGKHGHDGAARDAGGHVLDKFGAVFVIGEDRGGIGCVLQRGGRLKSEGRGGAGGSEPGVGVGLSTISAGQRVFSQFTLSLNLRFATLTFNRRVTSRFALSRSLRAHLGRVVTRQERSVLLIQGGHARRNRQAQHVRHRGGVAIGQRFRHAENLGRHHRHTREHPLERGKRGPRPIGRGRALLNVTAHLVPVEHDAHAGAGHRILVHLGGHAIVEGAVHLRQGAIHTHARHGVHHAAGPQLGGHADRLGRRGNQGITKSRKSLQQVKLLQGFLLGTRGYLRFIRTVLTHARYRALVR